MNTKPKRTFKRPEPRSEAHWQAVERYADEHANEAGPFERPELCELERSAERFEAMRAAALLTT